MQNAKDGLTTDNTSGTKARMQYEQVFDFGKWNQNTSVVQGKVTEAFADDGLDPTLIGNKMELKAKLKNLKQNLRTAKVKARKYKDIYHKLKLQLEKSPFDQKLQGQVLGSKEKIKEHIANYDKIQKQIQLVQASLKSKR